MLYYLIYLSVSFPEEADWMGILSGRVPPTPYYQQIPNFENRRLLDINLPGSHDAAVNLKENTAAARAQNLTIMGQLNSGVRFLDLRVRPSARKSQPTKLQTFHAPVSLLGQHRYFKGQLFFDILVEVDRFLTDHPNEIVIFKIKPAKDSDSEVMKRLSLQLDTLPRLKKRVIQQSEISVEQIKHITYKNCINMDKRLLIIFESKIVKHNLIFSNEDLLYSNPPLGSDPKSLVSGLQEKLPELKDPKLQDKFVLFHWTITFSVFNFAGIESTTNDLEKTTDFSITLHKAIFPLNKMFQIVMMDFVDSMKCLRVILLNQAKFDEYFRRTPSTSPSSHIPSGLAPSNSYRRHYGNHKYSTRHYHRRHRGY